MRRILTLIIVALFVLAPAGPAFAGTPEIVAPVVVDIGYYVDPSLTVDTNSLSNSITRAGNAGYRVMVVLLDSDPSGGSTTFAGGVLDRVGDGTVLVLSENQDGAESTEFSQAQLEAALDAGFEAGGGDAGYVDAFVDQLIAGSAPATTVASGGSESDSGGGSGGFLIFILIVGGLVALVWWLIRRSKKQSEASALDRVEEARHEIRGQLDAMANIILEISDQVSASSTRDDNAYLEQASKTFTDASDSFEAADEMSKLETLSDRLDEARWQLDAAAAIADGKPAPEKPKPEERHACFFDPTHQGPFEEASIKTSAGEKKVVVCSPDAEKLRRGQEPSTRMIEVGGRQVPAATAPRSYGGGGLDLGDLFAVIVGGMGQARSYDWSSRRSQRTRYTSSPSSSSSRSVGKSVGSTSRRKSSSSAGKTRKRAGRTRKRRSR
ncbi:hypothetical protein HQ535_07220 [bacterium]|nr:hypothetical protein [bacterium]